MKRFALPFFLLTLSLTPLSNTFSQSSYQIHIGPSFALSDYGVYPIHTPDRDYYASGAMGIDAGFQYTYQWSEIGFGVYASADFIVSRVNEDWVNKCYELTFYWDLKELPVYLYLPLSGGLSYTYKASKLFSLTGHVGMTYNRLKVTDNMWENCNRETDWTSGFGIKAGAGILLWGRLPLTVNYLGLGKHQIVERLIQAVDPWVHNYEIDVHLLTVTTGWVF